MTIKWIKALIAKVAYNVWKAMAEKGRVEPIALIGLDAYYYDMSGKQRVIGTITGYGDQGFAITCLKDKKVFKDKRLFCYYKESNQEIQIYKP